MSLIIPANSAAASGGYAVDNSCRFNSGDNCKISRTSPNSSPTNAKKFTISFWVKRSNIDAGSGHEHQQIFDSNDGSAGPNIQFQMYFTGNTLRLQTHNDSNKMELVTNRLFRDISAWYSIIFSYDSTPSTPSASSVRLWINGVLETSFSTAVYPSQNTDGEFAIQNHIQIIGNIVANSRDLGGYLAEVIGVDGQALVNTDFGEFDEDSGIFKPIDVSGIDVGTLGFYLDFEDSSALGNDVSGVGDFTLANLAAIDQSTDTCTNNFSTLNPLDVGDKDGRTLSNGNLDFEDSSALGNDVSGVGDFTLANLAAIDQTTDTCTNNFATMNPLDNFFAGSTFTEGNTTVDMTTSGVETFNTSTFAVSSGLWYAECKLIDSSSKPMVGISHAIPIAIGNVLGNSGFGYAYMGEDGQVKAEGSNGAYGATYTTNDIIGVYLDLTANKLYFAKNGALQNSGTGVSITAAASTANGHYFFGAGKRHSDNNQVSWNFGNPSFTGTDKADANGYGSFEYDPSVGTFDGASKDFYAICTKNLAEYG